MNDTPSATAEAFRELRAVAIAFADEARWSEVERDLPAAARTLFTADGEIADDVFVDALNSADDALAGGSGDLARAVGVARADAIVAPRAESFGGDPFRLLKEGASLVFEGRTNYGASSVELAQSKAVLRLVAPEQFARKSGDAPSRGPILCAAFLARATELVSGAAQTPRFAGHAPRIDARFNRPMVNLLFEFDLEE